MIRRASVCGEPVTLHVLPERGEHNAFARFFEAALDKGQGIVGLDVETTEITQSKAFDPAARLRMVQFGGRRCAWCLDGQDRYWRGAISEVLADARLRYASHTNYDVLWCLREFGVDLAAAGRAIDTKVIADLLWPGAPPVGVPKDLKALSERHLDGGLVAAEAALLARFAELAPALPTGKTKKDGTPATRHPTGKALSAWGFTNVPLHDPAFTLYGGLDAIYVRWLLDRLAALLAERTPKLRALSAREQRIARLGTGIQWRGLRLDRERTREVLGEVEGEFENAVARLEIMLGFPARSPRRGDWLAERGVHGPRTKTGLLRLDKDTLPEFAERYAEHDILGPTFADMCIVSSHSNLVVNLRSILASADAAGDVHPSINTQAAVTGRMSITAPAMQTFKKDDKRLRGCFVARPGHVLVSADYDSQELKLAYVFSRDRTIGAVLRGGLSQHVVTARSIFGSAFRGKEESPVQYRAAKVLNFAQQYGAGPKRIGEQLGLHYEDARELWLSWRNTYAGLVEWTEAMSTRRVVVNPWGREIPRDRWRPYANGNYKIQSSGRDLLGDAVCRLADAGWAETIWLLIHDEIVLEVPEADAAAACAALEAAMYTVLRGVEMTAKAEILGHRWSGEKADSLLH